MQALKKHYEKFLLGAVLLGLAAAAAWLPINVSSVRESLQTATEVKRATKVELLPPLNLSTNQEVLNRLKAPPKLNYGEFGHNIFNPIPWKKRPDGTMVPLLERGLSELTVTNITPLYLKVDYQSLRDAGDGVRYQFQISREGSTNAAQRGPMLRYLTVGNKAEGVTLKDVKGPKEAPTEFSIELQDVRGTFAVTKENPLRIIMGHSADLRYDPEKRSFVKQRVGQKITLGGDAYNIVAITQADVTLEDVKTKKRKTIRLSGAQ